MCYEADKGINSTPLTSECYTKWAYFTVSKSTLGSTESCTLGCGVWSEKTEKNWPDKLRYSYWDICIYHETQWSLLILSYASFGLEVHEHFNNIWQQDLIKNTKFHDYRENDIYDWFNNRRYMAEISPIRRTIISNQSINWFNKHKLHQP